MCRHDGVLPGRGNRTDPRPGCPRCAGVPEDDRCGTCRTEGQIYRHTKCARCALREDLSTLMVEGATDPVTMGTIVEILCGADRPESVLKWERKATVRALLTRLFHGEIPLSHAGLDTAGGGVQISQLRSLLEHHGLLPPRDEHLAQFESWLAAKLDTIEEPTVRAPVEQFATWHHLRRLHPDSTAGHADGPPRSARQQITEAIKFLTWLHETHHRTVASCQQQDVDEWLASGPITRYHVRSLFAWAKKTSVNTVVRIDTQQAQGVRMLTQEQRLDWIKELLTGDVESLPHRVAGTLLLLYAQPLVKIVALRTTAIVSAPHETRISLGTEPVPVPEPFAGMLQDHLRNRPNLRTAGGMVVSPWLFPGHYPGKHLAPQAVMLRLRHQGINLLGARNSALRSLVTEVPSPVVANLLGYGDNCRWFRQVDRH